MRILLFITSLALPTAAMAQCPSDAEDLFACTFNNGAKSVTTCFADGAVSYAFGPTSGAVELELTRDVRDVDMYPWQGIGRWIAEEFTLGNGDYTYAMRYAIDRLSEDFVIEGDLIVRKGERVLATLTCDEGSVQTSGYPLPIYDAKVAAGQIWSNEDFEWKELKQ